MQKHDARITTSSDDSTIPSHTQVQAGQRRRQQDADMSSRNKQRRHETEQTAPNSHSLPSSAQPRTDELFPAGAAGQYAEPVGALAVATAPTPKSHLDAASPPQPGRLSCSNFLSEGMLARRLMIPKPPPTLHVRRSLTPLRLRSQFRAALLLTDKKFTAAAIRQHQEGNRLHPASALVRRCWRGYWRHGQHSLWCPSFHRRSD